MLVAPSHPLPVEQPAEASAEPGSAARPQNLRDPRPVWLSVGEMMPLPNGLRGVTLPPSPPNGRGGKAARAETEREGLLRALAAEQAAHLLPLDARRRSNILSLSCPPGTAPC